MANTFGKHDLDKEIKRPPDMNDYKATAGNDSSFDNESPNDDNHPTVLDILIFLVVICVAAYCLLGVILPFILKSLFGG